MRIPFWSAGLTLVCLLPATPGTADDSAAAAIADKFARASAGAATPVASPQSAPAATDPAAEIEAAARAEHDRRAALEAQREAETLRLAERLRESRRAKAEALDREERERLLAAKSTPPVTPPTPVAQAPVAQAPAVDPTATAATQVPAPSQEPKLVWPSPASSPLTAIRIAAKTHVTILLSMTPGAYGIRRFNRTQADPVACFGETCFISMGPDLAAKSMPRHLALGMGNVLGGRAGACKLQLTCIFRNIELPTGSAAFQPIDLHILSHDVREVSVVAPDTSCTVANGRLTCLGQIKSATYRALVVPEATARLAGSQTLKAKLADGLGEAITAAR